jgi:organic radical activating enzyme
VSEVFLSIQGEGPSAGVRAHFIRLQGCPVGCVWCDTKYTWDAAGGRASRIDPLLDEALALGEAPLLVLTGGEPLEHPGFVELLDAALPLWGRIEVETSGVEPPPRGHARLFWNVSPKLPSATGRWSDTWRHAEAWKAEPHATFKIVVGDTPDLDDALRLVVRFGLPPARVMLMPEGLTAAAVRTRTPALAQACARHGFTLSPRLHIERWGARRGV